MNECLYPINGRALRLPWPVGRQRHCDLCVCVCVCRVTVSTVTVCYLIALPKQSHDTMAPRRAKSESVPRMIHVHVPRWSRYCICLDSCEQRAVTVCGCRVMPHVPFPLGLTRSETATIAVGAVRSLWNAVRRCTVSGEAQGALDGGDRRGYLGGDIDVTPKGMRGRTKLRITSPPFPSQQNQPRRT